MTAEGAPRASAPSAPAGVSTRPARPDVRRRAGTSGALGVLPFAAYVLAFLLVPTAIAVGSGFFDADGAPTLANVAALADPVVVRTFANTLLLAAVTSVVGAVLGALVCSALIGTRASGALRSFVDAASGVLAQFAGVMLAFAFIAILGNQGVVTLLLRSAGVDIYADGIWLYDLPGLVLPYLSFQIPLMIITFLPALEGLKPQWAEANAALGGGTLTYWWRIGVPVLAPSFLGSLLLLFANAFSAYGTAAALISQGSAIVPLQIRGALSSEVLLGRANLAGALALGMIVVMAVVMTAYSLLGRRAARWQR